MLIPIYPPAFIYLAFSSDNFSVSGANLSKLPASIIGIHPLKYYFSSLQLHFYHISPYLFEIAEFYDHFLLADIVNCQNYE